MGSTGLEGAGLQVATLSKDVLVELSCEWEGCHAVLNSWSALQQVWVVMYLLWHSFLHTLLPNSWHFLIWQWHVMTKFRMNAMITVEAHEIVFKTSSGASRRVKNLDLSSNDHLRFLISFSGRTYSFANNFGIYFSTNTTTADELANRRVPFCAGFRDAQALPTTALRTSRDTSTVVI
ncbi:hypothetical protein PLICRDRAFT_297856 [Plicaturopsis crispa FD-325 SS-3]|nr:hypothetical protein PLICRDRAFT_297856 [Plicaturopsis crispa FD-325 SS-3]